jgi:hypothetical protein
MTSFIVIAKAKEKRLAYAKDYCANLQIDTFDITLIEQETAKNISSIGIETIKNMQKKIFLKPIKSQMKAIIIEDSHLLTTEAQNALLKVLEEPPNHTIIILSAQSKDTMLPTIISRCQVIELQAATIELTVKELREYTTFVKELPNYSLGERLKLAETLAKDKDKAIQWTEKLILFIREQLIKTYTLHTPSTLNSQVSILKSLQSLHNILRSTNVNPRFAIENTLLKSPNSQVSSLNSHT